MKPINDSPPSYKETMHFYINKTEESCVEQQYEELYEQESDFDIYENHMEDYESIRNEVMLEKQLEQHFPTKYVIVHSILLGLLSVILISLQIVAIKNNAALSYIGSAIWSGTYNLLTVFLALLTVKYRNTSFVTITVTMKLFGMIVSFGGFVVVQIVAFYHYNCIAASYYSNCYNSAMKPIHIAIIVLGVPCLILNLIFFLYFQIRVFGRFGQRLKTSF